MIYQNLKSKKRWQKLSFFEQIANIGSEIQRTVNWREKNLEYSKLAFERALELIDLTIEDKKNQKSGRLKELLRTKELLIDYFCFDNI
jgi:phenylalanyl-tRNA synthetase alpha subunit